MTPKEATRKRDQLSTDLASAEEALGHNQRQLEELHGDQRDHDTFDRDAAQSEADNLAAQETRITGQRDRAQAHLESAQSVLRSRELELTKTRWLTKERRRLKAEIADLRSKQAQLQKQCGLIDRNLGEVRESLRSIVEAVRTYDSYDADATFRRIAALESHAEPLSAQVADLIAHQRRVDDLLGPLLRERQDLSETMQKREADTKRLLQQQKKLDKQVDSAKRLQHELNDASISYERKLIHQQCEMEHGDGSPGAVLHRLREQRQEAAHAIRQNRSDIATSSQTLVKLDARIAQVADRCFRVITKLVIDGNNLCYDNSRSPGTPFIGVAALQQVVPALISRYEIVVVFDASIKSLLGIGEDGLKQRLPGCTLHIVPTPAQADETVLRLANHDMTTYVISNDRFRDYPDMTAVQNNRLISHEIADRRVMIHDLDIDLPYLQAIT